MAWITSARENFCSRAPAQVFHGNGISKGLTWKRYLPQLYFYSWKATPLLVSSLQAWVNDKSVGRLNAFFSILSIGSVSFFSFFLPKREGHFNATVGSILIQP